LESAIMTRGRKPVPTEVHLQRGTFNPTRHGTGRKHEVRATGDVGEPPEWLTPRQQEIYLAACASAPKGLLKSVDHSVLVAWVTAFHTLEVANAAQRDHIPVTVTTLPNGNQSWQRHPLDAVKAAARRDIIKAASELGFSPAARARIPEPPEALDDDPGEQFFRKREQQQRRQQLN
jgi:P27 family predicted phage terminase small subunit